MVIGHCNEEARWPYMNKQGMKRGWMAFFIFATVAFLLWLCHKQALDKQNVRYALRNTDLVIICQYGTAQDGTQLLGSTIATLSEAENEKMLSLLKASSGFHTTAPSLPADYILSLENIKKGEHPMTVSYLIATGELGRDHDWCYVPNVFKSWMKTLPKPHHAIYRITRTPYYENVQGTK
jgi:hypothetical protein